MGGGDAMAAWFMSTVVRARDTSIGCAADSCMVAAFPVRHSRYLGFRVSWGTLSLRGTVSAVPLAPAGLPAGARVPSASAAATAAEAAPAKAAAPDGGGAQWIADRAGVAAREGRGWGRC